MKFMMFCCMAVATGCAGAMVPESVHAAVAVSVAFAPPPPRAERVVVVRPGHAWIPGYWRWNGTRHVWVAGAWTYARPGYRYVPARWARVGPVWRFHAGYWRR